MTSPWERGFVEVADRCYVARYREWDVSIGVVVGAAGALVVDTRASAVQGRQVREDVARLPGHPEVRWVVNTHEHFDHVLGNSAFAAAGITAHENAAARMAAAVERIQQQFSVERDLDPAHPEITHQVLDDVRDSPLRRPDATFSSVATIDLGDRYVELAHPGRGHTDGDLVLRVPDCDVLFAGDLVEESADRDATPYFGADCWPLEWPATLDFVISLLGEESLVVPGHGAVVGRAFVETQREDIAAVADLVRGLAVAGVPVGEALAAGQGAPRSLPLADTYVDDPSGDREPASPQIGWPFAAHHLEHAVTRGYEHLGAVRPSLPLVTRESAGTTADRPAGRLAGD